MRSALLTSILFASVVIPVSASRDANARRGLRRAVIYTAIFDVLYLVACAYVFPRLPW